MIPLAGPVKTGKKSMTAVLRMINWLGLALCLLSLILRLPGLSSPSLMIPSRLVIPALFVCFFDLTIVSVQLRGTSLRAATVWARLAILLAILALSLDRPDASGNEFAGLFTHICFLAILASLVSVLGARRPGENAWALLCGIFLVIGLLPMLEGASLSRRFDVLDQLRLDSPWNYFLALVIFAGISNYLPTRFFMPSVLLGIGLAYHLRLIWKPDGRSPWRGEYWWILPWCLCLCLLVASLIAMKKRPQLSPFLQIWQPFRDAWGAAWALRVLERFNQSAVRNQWPVRLQWFGLLREEPRTMADVEFDEILARDTLAVFVKRFGEVDRISKLFN